MPRKNMWKVEEGVARLPVFDRAHLCRAAMEDQALAAEVLGLFLIQLPVMLQALRDADTPEAWAFATHALKGTAASIGAQRLQQLAVQLQTMPFPADPAARAPGIDAMMAAAAEFRAVAEGAGAQP